MPDRLATRLHDVVINRVAFVPKGDNPEADVVLWKANPDAADAHVEAATKATGTVKCPNCGMKIQPDATTCPFCDKATGFGKSAMDRFRDAIAKAAATKSESDGNHGASDYAYVPDATKPSTWKLRIDTAANTSAAAAALGPGYRGQKASIPSGDLAAVKAKVRAAWHKFYPDKSDDEMPSGIAKEDPVEKAPRFTTSRLERLRQAQESIATILAEAEGRKEDEVDDNTAKSFELPDDLPEDVRKYVEGLRKDLDDLKAKAAPAPVVKSDEDPIDVALAKADLDADTRTALVMAKAARADAESAQAKVAAMEKQAKLDAAIEKAKAWKHLTIPAEELGADLQKVAEVDADAAERLEKAFSRANAIASESLKEIGAGTGRGASEASDAMEKLNEMAKEHAKQNNVPQAVAFAEIIKTPEGKALHKEYREEVRES